MKNSVSPLHLDLPSDFYQILILSITDKIRSELMQKCRLPLLFCMWPILPRESQDSEL